MSLEISRSFFKVVLADAQGARRQFLGTCFPITPNGMMLTCRHVVEFEACEGLQLALEDASGKVVPVQRAETPDDPALDMALLRTDLDASAAVPFPILSPRLLKVGADVYSFGFFAVGRVGEPEAGYFGGRVVNFTRVEQPNHAGITLPFAVLEGMSGSPVLAYHGGVKLVGLATGNRQSRVVAFETADVKDGTERFRETINRIVEHGTAYHALAVVRFLTDIGADGFVVFE